MPMMFYIVPSDHLEHHGIKGQRWGVRRFQDKSGRLTAAGKARLKRSSNSSEDESLTDKGDAALLVAVLSAQALASVSVAAIQKGRREIQKSQYRRLNPTEHQISTDWASETELKYYKEDRDREKEFAKKVTKESDLKKKEKPGTVDDDIVAVNPNYRKSLGYQKNCMYCSAAFELRRRGYDVKARDRLYGGHDSEIADWYKDARPQAYDTAEEVLNAAKKQPNGARGMLSGAGPWGGHELSYDVNNGKLTIYDAQASRYWSEGDFKKNYAQGTVTRLDNLEVNWSGIGEVISEDSVNKKR